MLIQSELQHALINKKQVTEYYTYMLPAKLLCKKAGEIRCLYTHTHTYFYKQKNLKLVKMGICRESTGEIGWKRDF